MGMPTEELAGLLKRRLAIIADHAWRDRDPAGHLDALRGTSEAIAAWTGAHRAEIDPHLRHFLANASFENALAYVEKRSS